MIRRFSSRILLVVVGLLVVTLGGITLAVSAAAYRGALDQARETLLVGGRVFEELIHVQTLELLGSTRILAADFGFKEAVATAEETTIVSALNNHGARIGADFALLVDLQGRIQASTVPELLPGGHALPFPDLLGQALTTGESAGVVVLDGQLYQLVLAPVNAPAHIAWAGMAFVMDDRLAGHLKSLANVDVSLWASSRDIARGPAASTVQDDGSRRRLTSGLDSMLTGASALLQSGQPFVLDPLDLLVLPVPMGPEGAAPMGLLQASLSDAMASHRQLRDQVFLIAVIALVAAFLAAWVLGARLARPVHILADAARRIAQGKYDAPVQLRGRDEFAQLAESFNVMQAAIGEREARIFHQLYHDPLTGLPNRARVADVLQQLGEVAGTHPA
ncbi:MAG TPA: HAMP domain-containing protein, partial [Thioalkalivibrio sp.]|nr:HAMP domain-containing protein [Thioalkalivibrio sp.]